MWKRSDGSYDKVSGAKVNDWKGITGILGKNQKIVCSSEWRNFGQIYSLARKSEIFWTWV